jgi:TrmH family RNA methyltransferase
LSGNIAALVAEARRSPSLALVEGFHALKHALRFGAEIVDAVTDDPQALQRLAARLAPDLAEAMAARVRPAPAATLRAFLPEAGAPTVLAVARRPAVDLSALSAAGTAPLVFLERPTQLGNLGATVRTAAAAGAAGVLTSGIHDPWHPHAIRGSAGLHFALPVARVHSLPPGPRPLVAVHPDGQRLAPGVIPRGACLAFGTERDGLSAELLGRAERRVAIPMRPGVSSLNLAAAVAIVLYTVVAGEIDRTA